MTPVFIDTSFLIALLLTDDAMHEQAVEWQKSIASPLLTTEYIIIELFDALAAEPLRSRAIHTAALLRNDPAVTTVAASTSLQDEGIALFASRMDKGWSLTDCISFSVMKRYNVTEALTADRHFEQAGFDALLRRRPR